MNEFSQRYKVYHCMLSSVTRKPYDQNKVEDSKLYVFKARELRNNIFIIWTKITF